MAFFSSQKDPKIKRSHSTERIRSRPTESTPSSVAPVPPIRIRASSRPTTIYDPHSPELRVRGWDPKPPTPKLNATRHSLRRIPVPSLSIQDLRNLTPHDHPHRSPTIPSSRSTSVSRKSSIVEAGGASNATTTRTNTDHKSPADTQTSTSPRSSPNNWESPGDGSRNQWGGSDLNKSLPPILNSLIWVSSSKQVTPPMRSPSSGSQKPPRAVLRRKSSARPLPKSQPSDPSLTHLVSMPLPLDAAHLPKQSTSDERKPRSPGILLPPLSPRTLTPAGAVAAAYKEQEKRRKHSKDLVGPNTNGQLHRESHDEDGGVYYTVFGSSGKVVAVGAPENERWSRYDLGTHSNKSKSVSRKPSLGALGRLSRKSSTKLKKDETMNACGVSESEHGHERVTRDGKVGRLSFQGRRSASLPGKHRRKKSLGILVENPNAGLISDSPQSPSLPSKSGGWSLDDASPSTSGKLWKLMKRISTGGLREKYNTQEAAPPVPALPEGLLLTPPRLKPNPRSAPQSPNDSKPPMTRYIRGRSSFGDAPFTGRRRDTRGTPSLVFSHRPPTLSSGKNPSHRQPSTNTQSSSPVSSDKASSKFWQKSRSSSVSTFEDMPPLPGRAVTSGPILSPVELHKLEKEQATGDFSSPSSTVDSHSPNTPSNHHGSTIIVIRKPSLRGVRMRAGGEDSETDGMSTSDFVALPTPPRHHYKSNPHAIYHQSNDSNPIVGSVSTSPTIPMFSTEDVVNQFRPVNGNDGNMPRSPNPTQRSQSAGTTSNRVAITIQPPPRPQRSSKRKPLTMDQLVAARASQDHERDGRDRYRDQGAPPPASPLHPKERILGVSPEFGDRDGGGRSCGTFGSSQSMGLVELVKTSQDSSRENLRPSTSSHSRSPLLKFREMGGEEGGKKDKKALTEKEKVDKWDDLLEQSDRAGGTIHIGNTKLPSDSLRFSDYSTLTLSAI